MLKTEAEQMIRRTLEESEPPYEMSEEQISAMAQIIMKICGRMIEEAISSWKPNTQGGKPTFFS